MHDLSFRPTLSSVFPGYSLSYFVGFLLLLSVPAFLIACGSSGNANPCSTQADCTAHERCIDGLCIGKKGGSEPTNITDASTRDDAKAPQPDDNPKPGCSEPQPTCKNKGVCKSIVPKCIQKKWVCSYPDTFEKAETKCDGLDNDCDGKTDEDCDCTPGKTQDCGSNVGVCQTGSQKCSEDGKWSECIGAVDPQPEICDGRDNNCDGQVDEQLVRPCYGGSVETKGKGVCVEGKQRCEQGQWLQCQGAILPSVEICDGKDNDCDGQIDETLTKSCYSGPVSTAGVGTCVKGQRLCKQGQWQPCTGETLPSVEICDGKDNDCDGQVDEGIQRACYTGPTGTKGKGLCKGGTQTCQAGQWGNCAGEVVPAAEICDGKDNNCDGQIDNQLTAPLCSKTLGVCLGKHKRCGGSKGWLICTTQEYGSEYQANETTCDNKDNDCDGQVDEGIQRACYTGPAGTKGKGFCKEGTQTCKAGQWKGCVGEVVPTKEICDGIDNDCNGKTDDQLIAPFCSKTLGTCSGKRKRCGAVWGWQPCTDQDYGTRYQPVETICDGVDNDCDGQVDEGASICGNRKVCSAGRCICDTSKKFFPYGGTCIKDGDVCPTSLRRSGACVTQRDWAICDPNGRVGVLSCSTFTQPGLCLRTPAGYGCKAPSHMYAKASCLSLTAGYTNGPTWHVVMSGIGSNANNSIVSFVDTCVGGGKKYCGTVITSVTHQTSCLCGERSMICDGKRVYDVSFPNPSGQCEYFKGSYFGCVDPFTARSACSKSTSSRGFATYACY